MGEARRSKLDVNRSLRLAQVTSSFNLLNLIRQETDAIGVAVSFGKDSMCTLDLACRIFPRVEGYYLYRVRDMRIVADWSDAVLDRYGVHVRQYPHFDLSRLYRHAVLQPHWRGLGTEVPRVSMADIEGQFRADADVDWIAYGWRRNDSYSRTMIMKQTGGYDPKGRRVFPLRSWRRQDVYAYLDERRIARPSKLGRKEQGGLDFHPGALAELSEKYPDDWARWQVDFPLSDLQMMVEDWTDDVQAARPGDIARGARDEE